MDKTEHDFNFKEYFLAIAEKNGVEISVDAADKDATAGKFEELCTCLCEANKIHNLTAIKEEKDIILKHFIDSLLISKYIPENARMLDVGCGPGFPSLPIAIYRSDVTVMGVDSTSKKVNYVNETAKKLGLSNISALSSRAEELAKEVNDLSDEYKGDFKDSGAKGGARAGKKDEIDYKYRESFDFVTARAVASLPVLVELCLPFVKEGGLFVAMKAQNSDAELSAALSAINKCGGQYYKTVFKNLRAVDDDDPDADVKNEKRSLIIIKKVKKTPEIYPRIYSKIVKKPL